MYKYVNSYAVVQASSELSIPLEAQEELAKICEAMLYDVCDNPYTEDTAPSQADAARQVIQVIQDQYIDNEERRSALSEPLKASLLYYSTQWHKFVVDYVRAHYHEFAWWE